MIDEKILLGNYDTKIIACPICNHSLMVENKKTSHNLFNYLYSDLDFGLNYPGMHQSSHTLKSSLYQCENKECSGEVVLIEEEWSKLNPKNGSPAIWEFEPYIFNRKIKYMSPSVHIIKLPDNLSPALKKMLESSFALFWIDLDSCANKIRAALEIFLDEIKIKKQIKYFDRRSQKVKVKKLSLHERIGELKQNSMKFSKFGDNLKAIKWIGNTGSHSREDISLERVIQAYKIFEYIIDEVYLEQQKSIEKLSKEINKKKGKN